MLARDEIRFRPLEEMDFARLYVWWARGDLIFPWMPAAIPSEEFRLILGDHLAAYDEVAIVVNDRSSEKDPQKAVQGIILTRDAGEKAAEPHVIWLPWTAVRTKVITMAKYLDLLRRKRWGIILALYDDRSIFVKMVQLGLLRRAGTFYDYPYHEGQRTVIFETVPA